MPFIADLHIHSHFSRATSRDCNLPGLARWAQLKGVQVIGTGDCTHPAWFAELSDQLEPMDTGLYQLRPEAATAAAAEVPPSCRADVAFMVTGEISSIYKRAGRVRKVHSIVVLPDLATAAALNRKLDAIGNIRSDGRPILGLDPRDLLAMMLEINPAAYLIPAHIWTPWFSMLGSKSGFDSLEECFGDLAGEIFAVETGLSSDPAMNWRVSDLDRVALISNSDLHSPANLGRNATRFLCTPSFAAIREALQTRAPDAFGGTIDLFPEAGKYHCDGHRKCDFFCEPEESLAHDCRCPVCGKPLTLGVLHRVVALADRPKGQRPPLAPPCTHIIPLPEILANIFGCGVKTKKVNLAYRALLTAYGPELPILLDREPADLTRPAPPLLPEALARLRREAIIRKPGYDGEYGAISCFDDPERAELERTALVEQTRQLTRRASA